MVTKTPQQRATERQNEKRRNEPRLSSMFLSQEALDKLEWLAAKHGSKKAAIEFLIMNAAM